MTYQQYDAAASDVAYDRRPGGVYHNPGRDEAIAALILAFLFPILGFILALMSMGRSRRFGWEPEGIARAAMWISVLLFVVGIASWFWMARYAEFSFLRNLWWI